MSNYVYVKYNDAKILLQEGDVLLFRTKGLISNCIKMIGETPYSHVAISSKHNDNFEAIEMREWFGARTVSLENYLHECQQSKTEIDIFRPSKTFSSIKFDYESKTFIDYNKDFDGKAITECMRGMTAFPYGYARIWLILRMKLFRWHLLSQKNMDKVINEIPTNEIVYPVCSTLVAYCFLKNGYPLLRTKSTDYTEPGDIALSPRLNYLFTLAI